MERELISRRFKYGIWHEMYVIDKTVDMCGYITRAVVEYVVGYEPVKQSIWTFPPELEVMCLADYGTIESY